MKSPNGKGENRPNQARKLRCPTCKRIVESSAQDPPAPTKFFPFCSERCKLIDLGAWFDADYRIPARPDEESEGPQQDDSSTGPNPS